MISLMIFWLLRHNVTFAQRQENSYKNINLRFIENKFITTSVDHSFGDFRLTGFILRLKFEKLYVYTVQRGVRETHSASFRGIQNFNAATCRRISNGFLHLINIIPQNNTKNQLTIAN